MTVLEDVRAQALTYFTSRRIRDTEDLAQEALLRFWQQCEQGDPRNPDALMATIAYRLKVDAGRKADRAPELVPIPATEDDDRALEMAPFSDEDDYLLAIDLTRLTMALPEQQQETWALVELRGASFTEAGEIMGISRQAATKHYDHARARIRTALEN